MSINSNWPLSEWWSGKAQTKKYKRISFETVERKSVRHFPLKLL